MNMKIKFNTLHSMYQVFVLPTVKWTYDEFLYGYKNIELWWWKWGIEISYGIHK